MENERKRTTSELDSPRIGAGSSLVERMQTWRGAVEDYTVGTLIAIVLARRARRVDVEQSTGTSETASS